MSGSRQVPPGEPSDSGGESGGGPDPVSAIESAFASLRGGFGPGGPFGHGGPWGAGPRGPWEFGPGGPRRGRRGLIDDEADTSDDRFGHGPHEGPHHGPHHGAGARGGHAALRMLAGLAASGPSSVSELAQTIGVDQPRASRLAKSAIDAGHVRREVDPTDARRSILVITDAGRGALRATLGRRRAAVETALEGFTDVERAEFARLLTRFIDAWPRP